MDQYASACGKKDSAMLLDCKTLECKYIPLKLGGYTIVIANSNKPHNLVDSKYNERRYETEQALSALKQKLNVSCLADVSEEDFEKYGNLLSGKIYDRAKHVVEECARVNKAAEAMKAGDVKLLGELLSASHSSLRDLYEVTGFELDSLAGAEQSHPACVGARMTGAGFGGCTIAIVKSDGVEDFKKSVSEKYRAAVGYDTTFYDVDISDGIVAEKLK